jgi:Amt family ammonium transporter
MKKLLFFSMLGLFPMLSFAADTINSGDTAWVLTASAFVLLMTPGLAFFYAGMTSSKNVVSTLFQNFAAIGVIGVLWAICGYSLAFGTQGNSFIGDLSFLFLKGVEGTPNTDYASNIPHSAFMIFQCMFAIITPILMTGAIAERIKFKSFLLFMGLWSLFIYSPIAHWVWGVGGFIRNMGGLDFAGGMVVHMSAGFSALTLVLLLGKRKSFGVTETKPHDLGMVLLGTALLWFGWFGFNAGSALSAGALAAQAFGTTFLASATAFIGWMAVDWIRKGKPSAMGAGIGAVAGLVTITPASGFVSFNFALLIGLMAGCICNMAVTFIKETLKLDDTLDVIGCHGVGGVLGTLLTAVFSSKYVNSAGADGLIYGDATILKANLAGTVAIIFMSMVGTAIIYKIVDMIFEFRVSEIEEKQGLDFSQHGEVIGTNTIIENNHYMNKDSQKDQYTDNKIRMTK